MIWSLPSHRRTFLTIFLISCGQILIGNPSVVADEADEVKQLLSEMSAATRNLNYKGLFTFEVGGSLETYKLVHENKNGKEFERLLRLNGQEREIVRTGQSTDCLSPGDRLLRGLISGVGLSSDSLDSYQLFLGSEERVAERPAVAVQIQPIENDRYGYRLSIDRETHLPLKMILTGPDRRVLERIQFVELTVGDKVVVAEDLSEAAELSDAANKVEPDPRDCEDAELLALTGWEVQWLPRGFIFSGQKQLSSGDEMLTFTDGLATFSIFLSDNPERPPVQGRANLGATTAYMEQRQWQQVQYSVTVVGEIPLPTAKRVAEGLRYTTP